MEIESQEYGANIELKKGHDKTVFGRGRFGFDTDDITVSRRHVAFELKSGAKQTEPSKVTFEVLGKNPIWVRLKDDDEIRVFRRSEKGDLAAGDWFCLSGEKPSWFSLREIGIEGEEKRVPDEEDEFELAESSRSGSEFEGFDVSGVDPVKEFGFVLMGHEFDHYPKHMIRDAKRWEWFLEEEGKESEDEVEEFERKKRKMGVRKKRKKGEENESDEEWTGVSEEDKELVGSVRKIANRPKYSTRSKDRDKPQKGSSQGSKKSRQKKVYGAGVGADDDEEEEEEDDETLGGFVVGDEDVDQDEQINGDDEEEEVFDDDDEVDE